MGITFHPPSFRQFLGSPQEKNRLGSREGVAFIGENLADLPRSDWFAEGKLLEVCAEATEYSKLNPEARILVLEVTCGADYAIKRPREGFGGKERR
ncbi:hypothetical protein A3J19_03970 [Candidatus Daviesbacteria bacterium RIFCSPLOWO2_02_FULL_41_8]|uniref:Uncharacterized protein n=3 Tax=Candidatus Daviesiibacteriota TaxID=1752718 RepID=A0A1F5NL30_9BACT|nr:MAG: hypothetical protein A2871_04010 [Candidatus Daviesbacteria bacterium RIFCSPHIGHO2_01_FULL_41_23]OGE33876.1 MAG: hypothetical protein A3D83_00520 [Candidatus Daviesbacteria bacterium RIFCSPHIGHO2_02_FULL_41_10]OGE62293.1 MAG: hypothetical protein A2967_02460 [Candidatus Daviesbacteria bacterium RIFCSPLOWO2_01_FULL_41_32]OGE78389.1 MAG: hypothetical protein A3J19_03970 [Candidatus Daviesbacteria bacterium RIFCSPLOWO2_02_FULL_41_8]